MNDTNDNFISVEGHDPELYGFRSPKHGVNNGETDMPDLTNAVETYILEQDWNS